jgi:hypothetical protein
MTSRQLIEDIARVKTAEIKNNSKRRRTRKALVKMLSKKFEAAL